jgi:hypothetical protein
MGVVGVAVGAGFGVGDLGGGVGILALPIWIYAFIDSHRAVENFNHGLAPRTSGGGVIAACVVGVAVLVLGVAVSQTGAAIDTDSIEGQIAPELERQLQDQVPDATVSVTSVSCIAETGRHGTCIADVDDDLGQTEHVPIDFSVNGSGDALWHTTG